MSISNLVDNLKNMSLDSSFDPFYWAAQACPVLHSPVDWRETADAHVFTVDLPGMNKEDIKVEVDEGKVLQISGDKGEDKDESATWHRVERSRGKFCRRFQLPENVKPDEVKAFMENGVLKVVVPKQEVKKPELKVIPVEEN